MKCQACGRTNPKNASSCLGCGASLSAAAATQPPPSSTTQPAPPYTEPAAPTTVSGPASFWQRLVAYLIDSALLGVLSYLVTTVALSLTLGPGEVERLGSLQDPNQLMNDPAFSQVTSLVTWLLFVLIGVAWLYYAALESSKTQGTVGKKLLGLKVTDIAGNRVSFARASARFWAKLPSGLILYAGFIMAAFTPRRQALHDLIADTLVLTKQAQRDTPY